MSSMIPRGNINKLQIVSVALTPSAVSANTTAQQTFTVTGVIARLDSTRAVF